MNGLDIVILVCLAAFAIIGLFDGFIKGISALISLCAALFLANRYRAAASGLLTLLHIPDNHGIIGYLATFTIFYLGLKVIFLLLRKISHASGLSRPDRVLGGLLGLFKGSLVVLILIAALQLILPPRSAILADSSLLPYANQGLVCGKVLFPDTVLARLPKAGS